MVGNASANAAAVKWSSPATSGVCACAKRISVGPDFFVAAELSDDDLPQPLNNATSAPQMGRMELNRKGFETVRGMGWGKTSLARAPWSIGIHAANRSGQGREDANHGRTDRRESTWNLKRGKVLWIHRRRSQAEP